MKEEPPAVGAEVGHGAVDQGVVGGRERAPEGIAEEFSHTVRMILSRRSGSMR